MAIVSASLKIYDLPLPTIIVPRDEYVETMYVWGIVSLPDGVSRLMSKLSQAVPVERKSSFLIPSGTTFSLSFIVASNHMSIR